MDSTLNTCGNDNLKKLIAHTVMLNLVQHLFFKVKRL